MRLSRWLPESSAMRPFAIYSNSLISPISGRCSSMEFPFPPGRAFTQYWKTSRSPAISSIFRSGGFPQMSAPLPMGYLTRQMFPFTSIISLRKPFSPNWLHSERSNLKPVACFSYPTYTPYACLPRVYPFDVLPPGCHCFGIPSTPYGFDWNSLNRGWK